MLAFNFTTQLFGYFNMAGYLKMIVYPEIANPENPNVDLFIYVKKSLKC